MMLYTHRKKASNTMIHHPIVELHRMAAIGTATGKWRCRTPDSIRNLQIGNSFDGYTGF